MKSLARRAAPIDEDLASDVRTEAENALVEDVRRLVGGTINAGSLVDALVYRLLASLTPADVVRLAEETDALEVLRKAGDDLKESRRPPANVVWFRRKND